MFFSFVRFSANRKTWGRSLGAELLDEERDRIHDQIIVNALWDIQENLEIAQTLITELRDRGYSTTC